MEHDCFLLLADFSLSVPQESEDAVKALAKEKDLLEREKWDLRRQAKEATEHASTLRSQLDLKENRIKELEAELAMVREPDLFCGHPHTSILQSVCGTGPIYTVTPARYDFPLNHLKVERSSFNTASLVGLFLYVIIHFVGSKVYNMKARILNCRIPPSV